MEIKTLCIGIDISKYKHDVAAMSLEKKLLHRPFVIQESYEGYQYLLKKFAWLKQKYHVETYKIGFEATSDYWKNLFHFLIKQSDNYQVTVINPYQVRKYTESELRRSRTDPVSAVDIAAFMVEKSPPASFINNIIFDNIKDIDKEIHSLTKQKTMVKNKLRLELAKVAPEIEHHFTHIDGQQILAILTHFPTALDIQQADTKIIEAIRFGKKQRKISKNLVHKVKKMTRQSIAHKCGLGSGLVVQSLTHRIQQIQDDISRLKVQMVLLFETVKEQESLLSSIPGITKETAIVLEAYVGNVHRFGNVKQFVAYFGMNPMIDKSGISKNRISRLQKKGSGVVRKKLYMAALSIIRKKEGPLYRYYQRLVDSGKVKLVALCATMRKLLTIMYQMLKNNEAFDPNKL